MSDRVRVLSAALRETAERLLSPDEDVVGLGYAFKDGKPCCGIGRSLHRAGFTVQEEGSSVRAVTTYLAQPLPSFIRFAIANVDFKNDREYPINRNGVVAPLLRNLANLLDRIDQFK
jgi:hypothetical protein